MGFPSGFHRQVKKSERVCSDYSGLKICREIGLCDIVCISGIVEETQGRFESDAGSDFKLAS